MLLLSASSFEIGPPSIFVEIRLHNQREGEGLYVTQIGAHPLLNIASSTWHIPRCLLMLHWYAWVMKLLQVSTRFKIPLVGGHIVMF